MIYLKTLKLDGWLSYDKVEINLDEPGITYIKGKLGAGKSALLEAVLYLLFGKTIRKKSTVKDLANKVLANGYDISLTFFVNSNRYKVREVRDRPKKGLYFYKNGKDQRGKKDPETRQIIIKELQMSAEDFKSVAFLGQRQTQMLVDGDEAERAVALVDVFGLGKYDDLIERCLQDVKNLTDRKKETATKLKELKQTWQSLKDNLKSIAEPTKPDHSLLPKLATKIENIETETAAFQCKVDRANKIIGEASAIARQQDHVKEIKQQIATLKTKLSKLDKPDDDFRELEREVRDLQQQQAELQSQVTKASKRIEAALSAGNTCPVNNETCPVSIPRKYSKSIVINLKSEKVKAKEDLDSIAGALMDKTEALDRAKVYCSARYDLESRQAMIKKFNLDKDTPDVTTLERERDQHQAKVNELRSSATKLNSKRNEIFTALAVYEKQWEAYRSIRNTLARDRDLAKSLKAKLEKDSVDLQYLSGALAVFKKMKLYKIDLVLQLLNKHLKEVLGRISDGEYKAEFTSQRASSDKKKVLDKIGIMVYDSYKAIPIELCSGGQATEVGLAVLLSVWKTANSISQKGVSSLWLDEVFGPLDEEVVNRVFDSVINIVKELGPTSVKVISHSDLDTRLFDHVWTVTRKNGISKIKFA